MTFLGFIDDGQTLTRFIAGRDRIHAPCRVTFRPATTKDHSLVERKVKELYERNKKLDAESVIYETIASRIVSWEFMDETGSAIHESNGVKAPDPTADNIRKAMLPLQDRLITIVYSGIDGGDPDPWIDDSEDTAPVDEVEANEKNSMQP